MKVLQFKLALILALALVVLYPIIAPLVFAIVFGYLGRPLHKRLAEKIGAGTSAAAVTTLVLLIILFPVAATVKSLVASAGSIADFATKIIGKLAIVFEGTALSFDINSMSPAIQAGIEASGTLFISLPILVLNLFIMLLALFELLKNWDSIEKYITRLARKPKHRKIVKNINSLMIGIIDGYFGTAILFGALSYPLFLILGIELATFNAILVSVTTLIPMVGSWVMFAILAVYSYLVGNSMVAIVLAIAGVIFGVAQIIVTPILTQRRSPVHP
ncbi:MAG: AI-2E family transporter, partial [archaeon]|nr:AI-2E family transporter [archaeon]